MTSDRPPPQMPTFTALEDERRHRKQRLAAGLRIFGRLGFEEGVAGHITARDPEEPDHFWVNPFGMGFGQIRVKDLLLVSGTGEVLEGDWELNEAAFCIHAAIHQARPDVVAAAHSHSLHGKAFSSLHRRLEPLTQDACLFYDDHALYTEFGGRVLDDEQGKQIAHALGETRACILGNHGLLTVGASVDVAVWLFVSMERSCQAQLLAMAAGEPHVIDGDIAGFTRDQLTDPRLLWLSAQPLFDWILQEEPDLLEE